MCAVAHCECQAACRPMTELVCSVDPDAIASLRVLAAGRNPTVGPTTPATANLIEKRATSGFVRSAEPKLIRPCGTPAFAGHRARWSGAPPHHDNERFRTYSSVRPHL